MSDPHFSPRMEAEKEIRLLKKEVKRLTEENNILRSTLNEVSGCLGEDNTPVLCDGCLISIRLALEGKTLGQIVKESHRG